MDLLKDANNCPFARFLPLGRISCEGPRNGICLITVVNFVFRNFGKQPHDYGTSQFLMGKSPHNFGPDLILLDVKMYRFFRAEIPEKRLQIPGADST